MNRVKLHNSLSELQSYCERQGFIGWDPYDGLNSRVFKLLSLNKFALFRLIWIQLFKRNPINLRRLLFVPKGYNPKGIGLFLSAYSKNLIHLGESESKEFFSLKKRVVELADLLVELRSEGYSGSCWGYNFDWQARGGLFFPSGTPTVVATTYAAYGLFDAYDATGERKYLHVALDSVKFVLKDLSRNYREDGTFLFSYSVLQGNNTVYNASLLGSKLLSRAYYYNKDEALIEVARESVQAVMNAQEKDGSWVYGELPIQSWKDSFHTGFNLECLADYLRFTDDKSIEDGVNRGLEYYTKNFFTDEGIPQYYHDGTYPIDIHSPAQLVVTLDSLGCLKEYGNLVDKVIEWTVNNMQDSKGYFYYQKNKFWSNKISYMRWSQAWMMHSLVVYINHEK
jgi:rhamnogalacturonyl hydrolase YesR